MEWNANIDELLKKIDNLKESLECIPESLEEFSTPSFKDSLKEILSLISWTEHSTGYLFGECKVNEIDAKWAIRDVEAIIGNVLIKVPHGSTIYLFAPGTNEREIQEWALAKFKDVLVAKELKENFWKQEYIEVKNVST